MWVRDSSKQSLMRCSNFGVVGKTLVTIVEGNPIDLGHYSSHERAMQELDKITKYLNSDLEMNLGVYQITEE